MCHSYYLYFYFYSSVLSAIYFYSYFSYFIHILLAGWLLLPAALFSRSIFIVKLLVYFYISFVYALHISQIFNCIFCSAFRLVLLVLLLFFW